MKYNLDLAININNTNTESINTKRGTCVYSIFFVSLKFYFFYAYQIKYTVILIIIYS